MKPTVPCRICGTQTTNLGTKLCDPCWKFQWSMFDAAVGLAAEVIKKAREGLSK